MGWRYLTLLRPLPAALTLVVIWTATAFWVALSFAFPVTWDVARVALAITLGLVSCFLFMKAVVAGPGHTNTIVGMSASDLIVFSVMSVAIMLFSLVPTKPFGRIPGIAVGISDAAVFCLLVAFTHSVGQILGFLRGARHRTSASSGRRELE